MIYYQLSYVIPSSYQHAFYIGKTYTQIRLTPDFHILKNNSYNFDFTISLVKIPNTEAAGFQVGSYDNKDYFWYKYT